MTQSSRRPLIVCAVGLPALAVLVFVAIGLGTRRIAPDDTPRIFGTQRTTPSETARILICKMSGGERPADASWSRSDETIIWLIRTPRVLTAMFVGAGLALAGALMQGLFRNPLASPGILGVSAGGALGAVVCIAFGWATVSIWPLPIAAFGGSFVTIFVVYVLASYHGDTPLATLLLAGIAVSAIAGSATSFVIVMVSRDSWEIGKEIVFWTLGELAARRWEHVGVVAGPVAIAAAGSVFVLRELNLMLLGEEQARTLGVDTRRLKIIVLALASLATGAAVAVSGLIGFVGLVVPHLLRMLVGPDHRSLVPAALLGGGIFLVVTDTVVRTLAPAELRLGIVTGALGAPFFLYLLLKNRDKAIHL
jgi:iron complex transport system permease protein